MKILFPKLSRNNIIIIKQEKELISRTSLIRLLNQGNINNNTDHIFYRDTTKKVKTIFFF